MIGIRRQHDRFLPTTQSVFADNTIGVGHQYIMQGSVVRSAHAHPYAGGNERLPRGQSVRRPSSLYPDKSGGMGESTEVSA